MIWTPTIADRSAASVNWQSPINWDHPLNKGRVAWWMVVPHWTGGTVWRDLCGRNHGTLTNMDPTNDWIRGRPNGWGALDFDKTDDRVATGFIPSQFSGTANLTIAAWAKATAFGDNMNVLTSDGKIFLRFSVAGSLEFIVLGLSDDRITLAHGIAAGTWARIFATYNGSFFELFVNGASIGNDDTSGTYTAPTAAFNIGSRSTTEYFGGQLDDVSLWSRALSPAEVALDYQLSRRFYPGVLNRGTRRFYSLPPAADTFTATAACTTGSATGAATCTHTPPVFTCTAAPTAGAATAAASCTHAPPVFTAAAAPTCAAATAAATCTHTAPTFTCAAAPTCAPPTAAASCTAAPPATYTCAAALTTAPATCQASNVQAADGFLRAQVSARPVLRARVVLGPRLRGAVSGRPVVKGDAEHG